MTDRHISLESTVPATLCGQRIDKVLSILFPSYSRERLNTWLKSKYITVDGVFLKSKEKVKGGEQIQIEVTLQEESALSPENIPLDIIYEDNELLIINKPAGLVVHPGAGNPKNTLVNALLYHNQALSLLPRAGLIHRIDKETTGLLLIAKQLNSYHHLVQAMQSREIERQYYALVNGQVISGATINEPIGRDPNNRIKMATVKNGKTAITHFRVEKRYGRHTLLDIKLETGRTHQIRVHMASIRHPLVGDKTYGAKVIIPKNANELLTTQLQQFKRQALHAYKLSLSHPVTDKLISVNVPIPTDMLSLLTLMDAHES